MTSPSPQKSRGGLRRIWNATLYSRDGLRDAWRHEAAFRQELLLVAVLLPLGLYLGDTGIERALLVGSLLLVLVVEGIGRGGKTLPCKVEGKEIGKYRLHRARKGSLLPVKMKPAFIL